MITKKYYINLSKSQLNMEFINACSNGKLEVVKFLLTSPELKENVDIHTECDSGIRGACIYEQLEMIKYLLTSPDLIEHADIHAQNDYGFIKVCENNNLDVLNYLIYDYKINITENIKNFFNNNKNKKISNIFELRELNESLNNNLKENNQSIKKIKL